MNPNETAMPPPFVSLPPGLRGGLSSPLEEKALEPKHRLRHGSRAISIEEHGCEPMNVAELFKEELSYRTQARRFLWEFFD